jgi:hypothetical protein
MSASQASLIRKRSAKRNTTPRGQPILLMDLLTTHLDGRGRG